MLKALLQAHSFSVPEFQRNYAWEEQQIDDFWNDLEYLVQRPTENHFVGSVILLRSENSRAQIIDGQQRLTTIFMLISLMRDMMCECETQTLPVLPGSGMFPINVLNKAVDYLFISHTGAPRLESNSMIRERFYDCVLRHPISIDPSRKIFTQREKPETLKLRKAYWKLDTNLRSYIDRKAGNHDENRLRALDELLTALTERMRILQISSTSQQEAINIYMTLNNRGLGLTAADLVKSLLMRHTTAGLFGKDLSVQISNVLKKWTDIQGNVSEPKFNQFLRHYLLVYAPEKDQIRERDIFGHFERIVQGTPSRPVSNPTQQANLCINDLLKKSDTYGKISGMFEDPELNYSNKLKIIGLNSILDSHRIFLLAVFDPELEISVEDRQKLLHACESLSLKWVITGSNAQILENSFQTLARELYNVELSLSDRISNVIQTINYELMPDTVIVNNRLKEPISSTSLIRYVLFRINESLNHEMGTINWDTKALQIEHIAPDTATEYWYEKFGIEEEDESDKKSSYGAFTDLFGNLSLLEFKLNSSIQNEDWDVKKSGQANPRYKGYRDSSLKITVDLTSIPEWNHHLVLRRTDWIKDCFHAIWNKDGSQRIETFNQWLGRE